MNTVNEKLRDEAISRAVDLSQYSNGVVRRILALLNAADADIAAALSAALEQVPQPWTVERLEMLLASVRMLNAQAYARVAPELASEMRRLAEAEVGYQFRLFESVIPPQVTMSVGVASVNVEQVAAAALSRPFQGRLLAEWSRSIEADRMARIRDTVRQGFVQQQPVAEIVRKIRGTKAKGYSDGIIEIDRRHAEAVVRTAISHTAGYARDKFFEANDDLIKAQVWSATIDTRTSEICRLRDGRQYQPVSPYKPIGHSYPWLGGPGRSHWSCRSAAVPVTRSWRELGIDADELEPGTRASMDGQIPSETTFQQWLKKQPASRQIEVLGETRAKMLRAGVPMENFYDAKGRWLTLDELAARSEMRKAA